MKGVYPQNEFLSEIFYLDLDEFLEAEGYIDFDKLASAVVKISDTAVIVDMLKFVHRDGVSCGRG